MTIHVLLFAQARDRAGRSRIVLELPDGSRVADALERLGHDHPGLVALRPHLAVAIDGRLVDAGAALASGCEMALLPPVSGG